MKRRKLKPLKGYQILLIGIYVKASNSDFEDTSWYIYYWDKKRRRLFEEQGWNVTPLMKHRGDVIPEGEEYYEAWASKKSQRSIPALIRKVDNDFDRLSNLFESYDIIIEEVGRL
jgi:hypothetical protein